MWWVKMKKDVYIVCHILCMDSRNGYGQAFGLYTFLAQKNDNIMFHLIVPRELDIYSDEEIYLSPNMKLRYIAPAGRIKADNHWQYHAMFSNDESVVEKLRALNPASDTIICDTIYYVSLTRKAFPEKKIIYRCIDVEYDKMLYCRCYQHDNISNEVADDAFAFEKKACEDADMIFALTAGDIDRMCELYNIDPGKTKVLPICSVNAHLNEMYIPRRRADKVSKALFLSNTKIINPEEVVKVFSKFPEIEFHMIGNCCYFLKDCSPNIILHGRVSDKERDKIISECDFALNITYMTFGMNVKMSDYFMEGIPVLANDLGVRGYNVRKNIHYVHADFDSLEDDIRGFCSLSADERYKIALKAFDHFCQNYNYENYMSLFDEITNQCEQYDYFIFGAGRVGEKTLQECQSEKYSCIGFVDNNKQRHGEIYCGKEIFSPEYVFEKVNSSPERYKIIIAMATKYAFEMLEQVLDNVDKSNIMIYKEFSCGNDSKLDEYDINKIKNFAIMQRENEDE